MTEIQRLVRYAKSSIGLQRLVHVKILSNIATNVGYEDTSIYIIPLLDGFSVDSERAVRQHLTEELPVLAKLCVSLGGDGGYQILLSQILPITARLLEDSESEVRQQACSALADIASLVDPDDLGQHVLTIILRLAHEDDKEEMRMTACDLLNSMAECLGQDLCKQFIIPEIVSLAEDPVFRVRKSAALNFHNICKVGGEHELFERLMPAFVRLSKDDMFRVRRACAESISEISKYVSDDIRIGVLVEIYLRLTQDPSKLVKQSVLQQSGLFISTLPRKHVNELILSHYCSMASGPTGDLSIDGELKHYCAYSFPAVLHTIGRERWREVRELYFTLVSSPVPVVKQTLAASLHEIAKILGDGTVVKNELIPIFEDMIQMQELESVQMGVIKHSAEFFKELPEPCRVSYLPSLHDILHSTNPFNWRLRQSLAVQLPELLMLSSEENVFNILFPLVMTLLQDPVACVRKSSFKGVGALLMRFISLLESGDKPLDAKSRHHCKVQLESITDAINNLIRGDVYQSRLLWVELAHQLLRDLPKHVFEKYFIDGILVLTCDPVSNVRVTMGIFLGGWAPDDIAPWEEPVDANTRISPWKWLLARADVSECVERLSRDDKDVYIGVSKLQPLFPDIKFEPISVRGKKTPPGGNNPIVNSVISHSDSSDNIDVDFELEERKSISIDEVSIGHIESTKAPIIQRDTSIQRGVGTPSLVVVDEVELGNWGPDSDMSPEALDHSVGLCKRRSSSFDESEDEYVPVPEHIANPQSVSIIGDETVSDSIAE